MKTYKERLASTTLTLSLLATGTGILAQDKVRPSAEQNVIRERDVVIATEGTPLPPEAMMGIVGAVNFNFISSEMSFDNKVVKGAPYSAEAVTETIQTLADGNRIVRKIAASVYRDGEGRTRREQALNHIGPFATNGDVPQTIFINDPVAGINYVLDPRSRIARKLAPPNFNFKPESLAFSMSNGGSRTPILNAGSHGRPHYPPEAKAAGIEGDVAVRVVINEAGEIVSATANEGPSSLRQAAVDAVKRWRTMPGNSKTGTGKTETVVNFKFSLPGSVSYKFSLPGGRDYNFNFSEKTDALMSKEMKRTLPPLGSFPMIASSNELSHSTFPRHKPVTESLGKQTIEGVEAEGTRSTITIPAGEIGNERPIEIVSERWYSPELQTVVMTKSSDPLIGETVYRLTSINRSEPAHTLFEVPADYTIKEGPGANIQRFRMPRPNNDDK